MTRSTIDPCLYVFEAAGSILWVCVYVDDALIADSNPELRTRFVADLSARFPTEDKGELSWILSVAITRDRQARTLSMSQELYVVDLITKFGSFLDASVTRTFDTPMKEGSVLSAADQPEVGSEAHAAMAGIVHACARHRSLYGKLTILTIFPYMGKLTILIDLVMFSQLTY